MIDGCPSQYRWIPEATGFLFRSSSVVNSVLILLVNDDVDPICGRSMEAIRPKNDVTIQQGAQTISRMEQGRPGERCRSIWSLSWLVV